MTLLARESGADGSLQVAPYYNRPTQEGLYLHFAAIAQAVDFPHILYNIPGRCGVEISIDTLVRLRQGHKNIVAVKHATGSMDGASELVSRTDLAVISGDDSMTLPIMSVGGVGVISVLANIVPNDVKAMCDAALKGDFTTARKWHLKMFKLAKGLLTLEVNPIPIKAAMAMRGLIPSDEMRLPMTQMAPGNRDKLAAALKEYGL